jgi:putative transposase
MWIGCRIKVRENQRILEPRRCIWRWASPMIGQKELLGMWISENEGAKFWLAVCTELRNRGMRRLLSCLRGWPHRTARGHPGGRMPHTQVQLCMVHLVRNSLKYVNDKQRAEVAKDLKAIYSAATEAEAEFQLELFAEKWDKQYPAISKSWRAHWTRVIPLFAFPEEIRKVIDTTNAIESVNRTLRKVTQNHRIFPSDEAVYKVLYLAIQNITKKWTMPIHNWKAALNWFVVEFAERFQH